MDAEVNGNVLSKGQNLPQRCSLEKLNFDNCLTMDEVASELLKLPTKPADSTVPGTPDSKREIGEYALDFTSPISCLPRALCFSSQNDILSPSGDSPRTPKDSVFDPFAPGPDQLLLAPLCQKYSADSRTSVARMLKFEQPPSFEGYMDHDTNVDTMPDEEMFETLYRMLLEIIVSKHTEEFLAGISNPFSDSDGDRTPTSAPLLSGIAESCPGAPKKTARKYIKIDKGLCKKIEF